MWLGHRRAILLIFALTLLACGACSLLGWPFVCNPRSLFVGGCNPQPPGGQVPNPHPSAYVPPAPAPAVSTPATTPVALAEAPVYFASQLAGGSNNSIRPGAEICAIGEVESTRKERDGDHHVWLCSRPVVPVGTETPTTPPRAWQAGPLPHTMPERRKLCVLGEIVPAHPLPVPGVGLHVRMCGLWVEKDLAHGWPELHPLTSWVVVVP